MGSHNVLSWWGLPLLCGVLACSGELAPLPEALIVVDTDADVPRLVNRLRVDFYASDGSWLESRDLPRRFERDWPASFSVYGEVEGVERSGWLRLRAYGEGNVRQYQGERYLPRPEGAGDPAELIEPPPPPEGEAPRLIRAGRDVTPPNEPLPALSIDRLLALRLAPGERIGQRVVLRGACFGTMADLSGRSSCFDTENQRAPAQTLPVNDDSASQLNDFGAPRRCGVEPRGDSGAPYHDAEVCVPGGAFLLGSRDATGVLNFAHGALPERVALISPFLVDKYEVTVARWRRARQEGFDYPLEPRRNDGPLPGGGPLTHPEFCTYSGQPLAGESREDYPLNCLDWGTARAFCRFYGGDLLSEAQWEYVAAATGDGFESLYPWGNSEPNCSDHVYGRPVVGTVSGFCADSAYGPAPVGAGRGDVTPLGVHDLGGSMSEWVRDNPEPYAARCWLSQGLADPECNHGGSRRSLRGASWQSGPGQTLAASRVAPVPATTYTLDSGFRCARAGTGGAP